MRTKIRDAVLLTLLCFGLTGCFDWTIPAGANLTCDDTVEQGESGCPEGWTCTAGYCRSDSCGNDRIDPGEECDDGLENSDRTSGSVVSSVCRTDCRLFYCGDGVIDEGEACDDLADGDDSDGCSDTCQRIGRCGDGIVQGAVETCEDGNRVNGDGCSSNCISEEGFVLLERGTVSMGNEAVAGAWPAHEVVISREFFMQVHEVTQREWLEVMGVFRGEGPFNQGCLDCPVENVSWYDALAYCNEKSRQVGLQPCYSVLPPKEDEAGEATSLEFAEVSIDFSRGLSCTGYRLPTEAEWEYAVRAGGVDNSDRFHGSTGAGDTLHDENNSCYTNLDLGAIGWHCANSWQGTWSGNNNDSHTQPVMQKEPNAWGLYDMLGNVEEWVWDYWQPFGTTESVKQLGPDTGADRVKRGGAYFESAEHCTMASREAHSPNDRDKSIGFRVVRTVQAW